MANVETDVFYFKDDVGKNLYRKKLLRQGSYT